MVLADRRFARADKRSKLPKWIQEQMDHPLVGGRSASVTDLSVDEAVHLCKRFMRFMGQPAHEGALGLALWDRERIAQEEAKRTAQAFQTA